MFRLFFLFTCCLYLPCFNFLDNDKSIKLTNGIPLSDLNSYQKHTKWFFEQQTPVKRHDYTWLSANVLAPDRKQQFEIAKTGFQPPDMESLTTVSPPTASNISYPDANNGKGKDQKPERHNITTNFNPTIRIWPHKTPRSAPPIQLRNITAPWCPFHSNPPPHRPSPGRTYPVTVNPASLPRSLTKHLKNVNKPDFPPKMIFRPEPRGKRDATLLPANASTSFTAFKPAVTPLRVANSVSIKFRNTYYYATNSKQLTVHLPFKDIIQTILGLYDFTAVLNDNARLDSMQFRELQINQISDKRFIVRSYENYNYYEDQTGLCSALNLSHVNPLSLKTSLNGSLTYFLPITIYGSNSKIFCKIGTSENIIGKGCLKYLLNICTKFSYTCDFQLDSKFDDIRGSPPNVYHAVASKSTLYIVDSSRTAAIICTGNAATSQTSAYTLDRFYSNIYFSKLSSVFLSLLDTIHIQLITLEELFFMMQPPIQIGIHKQQTKPFLIKEIYKYAPILLNTFDGNNLLVMGAREEQVLQTAMIMDQPLMDTFISIRNKPRAYWDKYNTTDLSKIAYSLKTLYFDVSAAYSFFLPGTKESKTFSLPIAHIIQSGTTPAAYKTAITQQLHRSITDREILFLYTIIKNYLIECIYSMRHHIHITFVIPPFSKVADILRHPPQRPDKRSTVLAFPNEIVESTVDNMTENNDLSNLTHIETPVILNDTAELEILNTSLFWQMPKPSMVLSNVDHDLYNQLRRKRNIFSNFFSDLLGLPNYSDLEKITDSERELLQEQITVEKHLSALSNSSRTLYAEVNGFRSSLNKFENDNHLLGNQLLSILNTESELTKEISTITKSMDSNIKNTISYTQLSAGITSLIHHLDTLTTSVQSLYTADFPSTLVSTSEIFALIPTNTLISIKFASMRASMTDTGHAIIISLPVIEDHFLVYELSSLPFLVEPIPLNVSNNTKHFVTHQMSFPSKFVALGMNEVYFQFDMNPCSAKDEMVLCHPLDIQVRNINDSCYRQIMTESGIKPCLGWMTASSGSIPLQQYMYSADRLKVLIFSPTADSASFFCKGDPVSHASDSISLAPGLSQIVLPARCTIRTRELFIHSATIMGLTELTLEYSPQSDIFAKDILDIHTSISDLSGIDFSSLLSNIKSYETTLNNMPIINLTDAQTRLYPGESIAAFRPFDLDISSPVQAAIWLQILCIIISVLFVIGSCYCLTWCCCPRTSEIWQKRCITLCCCLFCCKLRRRNRADLPLPMVPPRNHHVTINDTPAIIHNQGQIAPRAPAESAPGSRRQSLTQQFLRGFARRSLGPEIKSANWTINTYEHRVRLVCSFKDTDVFYNVIQQCPVDILDWPYTSSISQLQPPTEELLLAYAIAVQARPRPLYSLSNGKITYRDYYYNNQAQTWFSLSNDKPVDGIRHPDN